MICILVQQFLITILSEYNPINTLSGVITQEMFDIIMRMVVLGGGVSRDLVVSELGFKSGDPVSRSADGHHS